LALASLLRWPSVICLGVRTQAGRCEISWLSGNKGESGVFCLLQAQQQGAGLDNGESVGWSLGEHASKSKLGDGATGKVGRVVRPNPGGDTSVELVIEEAQSDQGVYVKQIDHAGRTILGRAF
jgi:hypothetical protein